MRALLTRVAIDKQQSTINLGVGTRRTLTFTNARTHARTHAPRRIYPPHDFLTPHESGRQVGTTANKKWAIESASAP
jgi:hypothetical protein